MSILSGKVNVAQIDKSLLFRGNKGTYLDLIFFENKDGEDKYGNTHFIVQGVTKEQRENGVKGPIIGNAKLSRGSAPSKRPSGSKPSYRQQEQEDDQVPF